MTEMIDFEPVYYEGFLTEKYKNTFKRIESAIRDLDPVRPDATAPAMAAEVRNLLPIDPTLPEPRSTGIVENFWEQIVIIAKCIPYRHPAQIFLSQMMIELLKTSPGNEEQDATDPWKSLPLLRRVMRDNWIDPTIDEGGEPEDENYTLDQWLNFNSFIARVMSFEPIRNFTFPIWQLRDGIEEDVPADPVGDNRVLVNCEWLIHCGKFILHRSLSGDVFDDAKRRSLAPGKLFAGDPGVNLERWGFWRRRLTGLRPHVGEAAQKSIDEALESMTSAEENLASLVKE